MSVIWKHQLDVAKNQFVHLPADARILNVGVQNDYPVIWFLTEGKDIEPRRHIFSVVTTGEGFEFTDPNKFAINDGCYIGTVTLGKDMTSGNPSAWYVAHIFSCPVRILKEKVEDRRMIQQELSS